MDKSHSYLTHDKHQDLFDSLLKSIMLDEAIERGDANLDKVLRKRDCGDDEDEDPSAGPNQGKKTKRRRTKESESSKKSSTSKDTSKGNTPPQTSKSDKSVHVEESVAKPSTEVIIDVEDNTANDDVVNDTDQPQDDSVKKIDTGSNNLQCLLLLIQNGTRSKKLMILKNKPAVENHPKHSEQMFDKEGLWDEFKYHITCQKTKPTKAEKLPYPRLISNNNAINQRSDAEMHSELKDERFKTIKVTKKGVIHYGLQIPDIMLNDTIKEIDVYKEFVVKCKRAVVLMVQPQPVVPTQGTHKKSRVEEVRKTRVKGPMMRGEEVIEHVD
ncbi:hypothetical protein Tco_0941352 [Tanacetum coccineum]|uniref:Uncharacterized protein n=1 Tax=Tanacetum coccineum TaxID=301880 RepID=A0ABQ5DQS7_9ASTR